MIADENARPFGEIYPAWKHHPPRLLSDDELRGGHRENSELGRDLLPCLRLGDGTYPGSMEDGQVVMCLDDGRRVLSVLRVGPNGLEHRFRMLDAADNQIIEVTNLRELALYLDGLISTPPPE